MNIINIRQLDEENVIKKVNEFLGLAKKDFVENDLKERIKELCVERLCVALGIKCQHNYQNEYFQFFSCIAGEAVCEKLNLGIHIANDSLRLVKYNRVNLIETAVLFFNQECVEEAIVDIFNFAHNNNYLLPYLKCYENRE